MKSGAARGVASFVAAMVLATALGTIGAQLYAPDVYGAGFYVFTTVLLLPLLLPIAVLGTLAAGLLYERTALSQAGRSRLALVFSVLTVVAGGFVVFWVGCTVSLHRLITRR